MDSQPFGYYPCCEGYGSLTRVASEYLEEDPTLVEIVRYLRAQEAVINQIASDLVMSRTPTARQNPGDHEVATASNNEHILVGRPIRSLRSALTFMLAHPTMTPAELHHNLDAFC